MLEIEYTTASKETAAATLDFLLNRPLMSLVFRLMKISCFLLLLVFAAAVYNKQARPQDIATAIIAIAWFFFYKKINHWVVSKSLKMRKFDTYTCMYKIDDKSIMYKLHNYAPQNIQWQKLKYVFKNQDGYIIPLTGLSGAGRFLWLPLRSFSSPGIEQQFLDLADKFKLKVTAI